MGYEYLIPCQRLGREELDRLLREAPYFAVDRLYEYRSTNNQEFCKMPEATATEAGEHFTQEEL
jgi:hypothetical protein